MTAQARSRPIASGGLSQALRDSIAWAHANVDEALEYAMRYGRGIDKRKLRKARGGGKKQVHLASEKDLARDYPEFRPGRGAPNRRRSARPGRCRQPLGRARLARTGGGVARGVRASLDQRSLARQRS